MTYKNALNIKIGDVISSKGGYVFTVENIKKMSNVTEKYIQFTGTNTLGDKVTYGHKSVE